MLTTSPSNISRGDERVRRFGLFNAMVGIGLVIAPVPGGVLGEV